MAHDELNPRTGWVLYDGDCKMCIQLIRRLEPLFSHYGFQTAPLQSAWVRERLHLTEEHQQAELLKEMRALIGERVYGGADAILAIARHVWWAFPLWMLAYFPGVKALLRRLYRWIATRRHCTAQSCSIDP